MSIETAKSDKDAKRAATVQRGNLVRVATYVSVVVAIILIFAKFAAWIVTGSVAILSSLVDSLLDAIASIINLFAVRHALTPADDEHRFGHGKAEAMAALAQSAFIVGSSVFLLFQVIDRFIHPAAIQHSRVGLLVMMGSIILTFGLVALQNFVVKRTGSLAITADSLHYKGDLLANLAVIAAILLVSELGWVWADPVLAMLIAGYIIFGAVRILRAALNQLMDRELPDEIRDEIRDIVMSHDKVRNMHDLRTRSSGMQTFIQLHLELDGEITLGRAHEISDSVEKRLLSRFPDAEVIIHQDPAGLMEQHGELAQH